MTSARLVMALSALIAPLAAHAQQKGKSPPPPLKEIRLNTRGPCFSLAFGPNDRTLAAGIDGGVQLLPPTGDKGKPGAVRILRHRGPVDQIEYSLAANALIAKSINDTVLVWDAESLRPVRYVVEDLSVLGFVYQAFPKGSKRPERSCFALSHRRSGIRLWMPRPKRRGRIPVLEVHLRRASGTPFGRVTAAASGKSALLLGNERGDLFKISDPAALLGHADETTALLGNSRRDASRSPKLQAHRGAITSISMAADSGRCVTAGADGYLRMWKLDVIAGSSITRKFSGRDAEWEIPGRIGTLSDDGRFLAVAGPKGVGVFHAASGLALAWNPRSPKSGRIVRLRFNGDGSVLAGIVCRCGSCIGIRRAAMAGALHGGQVVIWK